MDNKEYYYLLYVSAKKHFDKFVKNYIKEVEVDEDTSNTLKKLRQIKVEALEEYIQHY
jgi:hypothetical protein